jgi:adenylylsulfate kinase-like enzyme
MNTVVIHISGSPGSGKTTILKYLQKKYKKYEDIIFKDTDDFSVPLFKSKKFNKIDSDRDRGILYKKYMEKEINDFINDHKGKIIILAGLTLYFSIPHYKAHSPKIKAEQFYGFFIDISNSKLIEQRFNRDIKEICLNIRKHEKSILSGKLEISFSASSVKNYARIEKAYYEKIGYKLKKEKKILESIKSIVKEWY